LPWWEGVVDAAAAGVGGGRLRLGRLGREPFPGEKDSEREGGREEEGAFP
jgi:hypothetical protein